MKAWWSQLEVRERQLLSVMLPLVALALFYWLIWQPLHSHLDAAKTGLQAQQKQLSWTRQGLTTLNAAKGRTQSGQVARGSLSQQVSQLAKAQQIELSRMQPQGAQLDLRIDTVTFDRFLSFLAALESRGVVVEQLNLAASDSAGSVKVRSLRLGRGA